MNNIKLVIDNDLLELYRKYYFHKYSKRRTFPIDSVFPASLNRFIAMHRLNQNTHKQQFKEFSEWMARHFKIADLNLDKVTETFTFYFPDHRRRDFDNLILAPKFINDGFVSANVFLDDSGDILKLEFNSFEFDKINPRMVIELKYD